MGGHVGVPLSTEHRAKLSTALKGRQFKPEHSVAMRRFYARQREPLIGRTFGRLTILDNAMPQGKYKVAAFLCRCTCGTQKVVIWGSLQSGNTQSCGCLRTDADEQRRLTRIHLIRGQVFGRWTVFADAPTIPNHLPVAFFCVCACGTERVVSSDNLRCGSSKSCGCLRRKENIDHNIVSGKQWWWNTLNEEEQRGRSSLSE